VFSAGLCLTKDIGELNWEYRLFLFPHPINGHILVPSQLTNLMHSEGPFVDETAFEYFSDANAIVYSTSLHSIPLILRLANELYGFQLMALCDSAYRCIEVMPFRLVSALSVL